MREYYIMVLLVFTTLTVQPTTLPEVYNHARFEVEKTDGITYAYGLSHSSVNGSETREMPLKLDVYTPKQKESNRPVLVLIHGGKMSGGSRKNSGIVYMAEYFAARGWVVFSIDYRLKQDYGTVPDEWLKHESQLEPRYQFRSLATYPAVRDAKAAMRWIVSHAVDYKINTDCISVGGSSAGAVIAIALGITENEDYRDELTVKQDPTLKTTHLEASFKVKTVLDFWGLKKAVHYIDVVYGKQRFGADNADLLIVHGKEDAVIPIWKARELQTVYDAHHSPCTFCALEGYGHGAWHARYEGQALPVLSLSFIVQSQNLKLQ